MFERIVVLLQGGVPVDAVSLPNNFTCDEVKQFADQILNDRNKILVAAYVSLHPAVDAGRVGADDIPGLATYVLTVRTP